ncbi:hypothetical protein LIER_19709 [Lithospermum erythrorhizon]|uniref:HAT C-terminal dimerisation domain-containing protein n=1 Tax=Lithospermum erythrorhizon TaxID=34254 RepID=A0AAV3QIW0_LITER
MNERFTPESTELLQCIACLSHCSSFEAFDTKSLVRMARLYPKDFACVGDEELAAQLEVALTLPISTASVERVFSGMNYVKDDLRSKMGNAWLNDFLVTNIEKEVFSTVDDRDIINRFQAVKERRMTIKL